jgi:hypothetical protein
MGDFGAEGLKPIFIVARFVTNVVLRLVYVGGWCAREGGHPKGHPKGDITDYCESDYQ